jgi:hypothetical protein|tara:strand:+ start:2356 stop:5433 length:3078 start_codon:yes stop_codon:yes gene_type:complete
MSIQFRTRNSNIQPVGLTGACCISIGVPGCDIITFDECADMGGFFQGAGSTCVDCTEEMFARNLTGVCCACDGSCTDQVTEDWCRSRYLDPSTPRASFHSGKTCTEVECVSLQTFDCCSNGVVFGGICNEGLCRELGGRTADFGQGCDNSNLVAHSGACCNISVVGYERPCQYMDAQDPRWNGSPGAMCASLGGSFFQDEVCSDGFCVDSGKSLHTCCRNDGCISLPPEMCNDSNGLYMGEMGCANEPCSNIEWGACVTDTMCLKSDRNTCHEYLGEWFPGYSCEDTFLRGSWKNNKTGKVCRVFGEPQCIDNVTEQVAIEIATQDYNDTEWVFIEGAVCDECQENYHCYDPEDEVGMCIYSHVSESINTNPRSRSAFSTSKGWCRHLGNNWAPISGYPITNIFKGCGTDLTQLRQLNNLPIINPDSLLDGYPFNYYGSPQDGFALGACSTNGVCNNNTSMSDCQAQGGSYMGNGTHCSNSTIAVNGQTIDPNYSNYTNLLRRSTEGRFLEFISASYNDNVKALPEFYYKTDAGIHPPMAFPNDNLELRSPTYNAAARSIRGTKLNVSGKDAPLTDLSSIKTLSLLKSDRNGMYSALDIHGINFGLLNGLKKLEMMPDENVQLTSLPETIEEINLQGSVKTIEVTVLPKPINGNQYIIDGVARDTIFLYRGHTYRFNMSHESLTPTTGIEDHHPLRFSETMGGHHNGGIPFMQGVVSYKTVGKSGAYIDITIDDNTPETLYYHCMNHSEMGGEIQVRNNFLNKYVSFRNKPLLKKLFVNDVDLNSLILPLGDSLNILDCSRNNLTGIDITSHPYIYSLNVSHNNISSIDLNNFGSFDGDGSIDISHNNITSLSLPVFHGQTKLRHLSAHDNPLVIASIQNNSKIDVIDLSYTNLSFFELPPGTDVKELYMHNCRLGEILLTDTIDNSLNQCTIIDVSTNNLARVPFISSEDNTIPRNVDYINLANNNLSSEAISELMNALVHSYNRHLAPKLVINIKNNTGTVSTIDINTIREVWGNRLTIIHDV